MKKNEKNGKKMKKNMKKKQIWKNHRFVGRSDGSLGGSWLEGQISWPDRSSPNEIVQRT
jgi:hypothetical protein